MGGEKMRKIKAKFDGRVKIEPIVKDSELYRVGKSVCKVTSLDRFMGNALADTIWCQTAYFQDRNGKIRYRCDKSVADSGKSKFGKRSILKEKNFCSTARSIDGNCYRAGLNYEEKEDV